MKRPMAFVLVVAVLLLTMASGVWAGPPRPGDPKPTPGSDTPSLTPESLEGMFTQINANGFGDRHNNYMWSMEQFKGDIYVGTGRSVTTFNIMWELLWGAITPGQRPPELPDVDHPPFLQDIITQIATVGGLPIYRVLDETKLSDWVSHSQAEIWRYRFGTWTRVYQAPLVPASPTVRNPSGNAPSPAYQVAQTSGFRSMTTFTDKNGVEALYATSGGLSLALNSPMLYRTTNGTDWVPMKTPQEMGRETRAMCAFNGKLYVGVGSTGKIPAGVWCSANPKNPDSWKKVMEFSEAGGLDSHNQDVLVLSGYNNKLYVGTQNTSGFQVYRSNTSNPAAGGWTQVVTDGAGDRYNVNAQTMKVFNGMLYVASVSLPFLSGNNEFKGFEMIRIYPDDRWELVVGARNAAVPVPGYESRSPISGWTAGFGNPMAFYGWSMEVYDGNLFVGTLDTTVLLRYLDDYLEAGGTLPGGFDADKMLANMSAAQALPWMAGALPDIPGLELVITLSQAIAGSDVWMSSDGVTWIPVTIDGFNTPENYGIRTMKATPMGLFIGTCNPWAGGEIYSNAWMPWAIQR